ncbi:MAG: capsular biosynthesis protein [Pseudomonadota bacterium]|nr:capsular biosynthesis protein [Pseudomonadota bacterium]
MIIVFPMAGQSKRFRSVGYAQHKYKLLLDGKSVFQYAVNSFKNYFTDHKFLFVHRDNQGIKDFVINECNKIGLKHPLTVSLSRETRGQAETVWLGLKNLKLYKKEPLTIFNIDTFRNNFTFPSHFDLDKIDGYLEVFYGEGSNWSFVLPSVDGELYVKKTAEKVQISNLCSTGLYYFKEINEFNDAFYRLRADNAEGELYVAPLYNYLIARGKSILFHEVPRNTVTFCGTPEEYELLKQKLADADD